MKILSKIIIFILVPLAVKAADVDMVKIRDLYYKASSSKSDAESFFKVMQANLINPKTLNEGYKGMAYMIKANFAFNPYYKLSYFIKGKGLLDEAIENDLKNLELRFLRFCVQTNAPGFLGYSDKITDDKKIIISGYSNIKDLDLKRRVNDYMLNSKSCSKEEKQFFK